MEIANVFAINKADKPGVDRVAAEVRLMLELVRDKPWTPPVHLTVAENGTGVEEFAESIVRHHEFIKNSPEGARFEFRRLSSEVEDILLKNLTRKADKLWQSQKSEQLMEDLAARKTNPYLVASEILRKLFPQAEYNEGTKEANTSHVTPYN